MKKMMMMLFISTMILTGCGSETKIKENQVEDERFIMDERIDTHVAIITDTKTNVQYILLYDGFYSGSICPLYNENGEISIKGE